MSASAAASELTIESDSLPDETDNAVQLVSFRLADEEYGLDIMSVQEIILIGQVTQMPQVPDSVQSLINLRGHVIPIIDLRREFELEASEPTDESRALSKWLSRGVRLTCDGFQAVRVSEASAVIGNADAVKERLARHRIKLLAETIGGHKGRKTILDATSGAIRVEVIGAAREII